MGDESASQCQPSYGRNRPHGDPTLQSQLETAGFFWGSAVMMTGAALGLGLAGLSIQGNYGVTEKELQRMKKSDPNGGRMEKLGRMKIQQLFDQIPEENRPKPRERANDPVNFPMRSAIGIY